MEKTINTIAAEDVSRETSSATKSEEKRMFSQAINTIIIQVTKLAGKTADNIIILNEMK